MKILIVSDCPTHPVNAGNRKAILNQVELLRLLGHEIYFLYVYSAPLLNFKKYDDSILSDFWGNNLFVYRVSKIEHLRHLITKRLRTIFSENYSHVDDYYPLGLSSYANKLDEKHKFDCCIVNYYWLSKVLTKIKIPLKAIYTHDYFAYKDILVDNKKIGYCTNAHEEAKAMQRAPYIFALNCKEAVYFNKLSPKSKVYNTYCYYKYYESEVVGNNNILFFSGDNIFNLHGIKWFLSEIFPFLLKRNQNIKLLIGGGICSKLNIEHPNIEMVGYVTDIKDFYDLGDIVINPTFEGTGLKIKTFEAISFDKAVVAHPHSVEGIYNKENSPVYTSVNPEDWVEYIVTTLGDESKIKKIKNQDKNYIKEMNAFVKDEYLRFLSCKIER